MLTSGDDLGALLIGLLLRHFPLDDLGRIDGISTLGLYSALRENAQLIASTGTNISDYLYAPVDKILDELRRKMASE